MDPQLVDWGGSAVLLGIFWQLMAWSMRRLTRRLDRQDEDLAELKTDMVGLKRDVAGLRTDMVVVKADVAGLKEGQAGLRADVVGLKVGQASLQKDVVDLKGSQARMGDTLLQVVGDLGVVKGELRIVPREKAAAGGS